MAANDFGIFRDVEPALGILNSVPPDERHDAAALTTRAAIVTALGELALDRRALLEVRSLLHSWATQGDMLEGDELEHWLARLCAWEFYSDRRGALLHTTLRSLSDQPEGER